MMTNVTSERHTRELGPASRISFPGPFNPTVHCEKKKTKNKKNDYTSTNKYVAQVGCLEHSLGKMLLRLFRLTASDPLACDWLLRNSLN